MGLFTGAESSPECNETHAQCEHEHQGAEVREQLSPTRSLCFSNRTEHLVLGEVEPTGGEYVPSIRDVQQLQDVE